MARKRKRPRSKGQTAASGTRHRPLEEPEAAPEAPPRPGRKGLTGLRAGLVGLGLRGRLASALLLGAVAALALPPIHAVPLLVLSFGGLLWLLDGCRSLRAAFVAGWVFGLGYFAAGLYWIGLSFLVEADRYGWLAMPAVLGISAYLAIFPALAATATHALGGRGLVRVVAFAACWTAAEWLRGHVLTGFPWNLVGYTWTFSDAMIQGASVVGIYGLSFVTVLVAALPVLLGAAKPARPQALVPLSASVAIVLALWIGGEIRLASAGDATVPGIRLRLVQASIPQAIKWRSDQRGRIVSSYRELSTRQPSAGITHLIWPETALPIALPRESMEVEALADLVPKGGLLLTGAVRREGGPGPGMELWNSVLAIADSGTIVASYNKAHLVPFGEFVPLRGVLPIGKLTAGRVDFLPGPGPQTLLADSLPAFSPLVCYEVIFPGAVTDRSSRPQWLLNLTNDAWFGTSSGPYQHFAMARLRAVEEGLPLVRAANTGISGVVDGYGRVRGLLPLNESGVLDSDLPEALTDATLFSRYGDGILALVLAVGILLPPVVRGRGAGRDSGETRADA